MKISYLFRSFILLSGAVCLSSTLLHAQPGLSLASATVPSGGSTALNLSFTSSPSSPLAAVQWTFNFPATGVATLRAAPGPALSSAGKTLSCALAATSYTCVAWGLNGYSDSCVNRGAGVECSPCRALPA